MDAAETQQKLIHARIERARKAYPALWRAVISDWAEDDEQDAVWLTYAANYVFRTAGIRWALDPFCLSNRLHGMEVPDFATDFMGCSAIVLTHTHRDHLDLTLLEALEGLPLQWVIPTYMREAVESRIKLPSSQVIVPVNGEPIHLGGLTLTPFAGLHLTVGHGVPSTGYLAEFGDKRWLIPGDTRVYDLAQLPCFGRLDGVLAHLWLGRGAALESTPPLLDEFCAFFAGLAAEQVVLTHLHELERPPADYWDERHVDLVSQKLQGTAPHLQVAAAMMGERVYL